MNQHSGMPAPGQRPAAAPPPVPNPPPPGIPAQARAPGPSYGGGPPLPPPPVADLAPHGPAAVPGAPARGRRVLAWLIDFSVVLAVAAGLVYLTYHRVSSLVTDIPTLTEKSAWQILTSRGDVIEAAEGIGRSVWGSIVLAVQQAFGLLVLFTFLYQFACLALGGRTLGKLLMDLRVAPHGAAGTNGSPHRLPARRAAARALVTAVADVGLLAVACCLLVDGQFLLALLFWVLATVVFWLNAAPAVLGSARSLADRVAGTSVSGGQLFRATARVAADGGRAAWQAGQQATQRVGRQASQVGQRVAASERGRAAADQARVAAERGRAVLGRARSAAARRRDDRRAGEER